jgi:hypothetical protein
MLEGTAGFHVPRRLLFWKYLPMKKLDTQNSFYTAMEPVQQLCYDKLHVWGSFLFSVWISNHIHLENTWRRKIYPSSDLVCLQPCQLPAMIHSKRTPCTTAAERFALLNFKIPSFVRKDATRSSLAAPRQSKRPRNTVMLRDKFTIKSTHCFPAQDWD